MRLDSYLATIYPDYSRSRLADLIAGGRVTINGVVAKAKSLRVEDGADIEVDFPEVEELSIEPENIPLCIVYEDEDLLVVNKPSGMTVHPAAGISSGTLVNAIMYHCGESLSGINGIARPGIVHRIDKDTSGLLMVAKNDAAHASLAEQLAEHSTARAYLALVYGKFKEESGTIDAPIGRDPKDRKRMAVGKSLRQGKAIQRVDQSEARRRGYREAVTHWKRKESFVCAGEPLSLIECRLETGRTHQIRVHMAAIGHPLLGDPVYGPKRLGKAAATLLGKDYEGGQLLHAYLLGFRHPRTGEYMEFQAPLPEDFERIISKLRG